jgi:4-alpha-glucanotransferase
MSLIERLHPRQAGVLLHPSSFPGPYGIGDLGSAAHAWLDWLADSGCTLWQVLPLGPTGYGDSPYQSLSSFAGNPLLIAPDELLQEGLLDAQDLDPRPEAPPDRVDFGEAIAYKDRLLALASERFRSRASQSLQDDYDSFCADQSEWLEDFVLFVSLKRSLQGRAWTQWPEELSGRQPDALRQAAASLSEEIAEHRLRQFLFDRQWQAVHRRAQELGITLIGDIPIFVAHDSADVWSAPELFHLRADGEPEVVAGVPPDYFSPTGQLWGNPLYRWSAHQADGFAWWIRRFRSVLRSVDVIRLDHFRGLDAYWEIPGGAPTAEKGRWAPGPGNDLLEAVRQNLGELPIIAEDLGFITPGVRQLRDSFGLPGMKVIQFAFGGDADEDFLPHNYLPRCVVYTGTHDNDTTRGWYASAPEAEQDFCRRYLARDGQEISWDLLRLAWASVADWAIAPLQDILELGTEARMNFPGRPQGNWGWRFQAAHLTPGLAARLFELNDLFGRRPSVIEETLEA